MTPPADPCSHRAPLPALDPFVPRAFDANLTLTAALDQARTSLVGAWTGILSTPWTIDRSVELTFSSDGHYSAHCVDVGCCVAFYWGSDLDSDIKQWTIDQVDGTGAASGMLDVAFCYPPDPCYLPSWQGLILAVRFDTTGDRLEFEFARDDGYGPLKYELKRL